VIQLALIVAAATLGIGLVVALLLKLLPTVRLQLAGLALLAVVLPLGAVLLSGWVMFHMGDDVKILAVASASASAAVLAGLFLAHGIVQRLDHLRNSSAALAAGDLSARAEEGGPAELDELSHSFNEMAANLSLLFDSRRELVTWASHDLRTPIASLQAMIEAMEDGLVPPERFYPVMHEQVRTLARLVDDIFELARIDAGALSLELREAELGSLVQSCVRGVEAEAQLRGVRVQADLAGGARVRCQPDKVERVLYNLLTNALRHTPSDGSVAVRLEPGASEVRVSVEDTGDGLTPETAERMFERFWRGDRARSSNGAGLGLAIARGLVEAHGGRIWAERPLAGGARVSFTLPLVPQVETRSSATA
jgi:signal transduction histidine kinase